MKAPKFLLAFVLFIPQILASQDSISLDDYSRAVGFLGENLNNKKVFNLHIQPNWFPDSTGLWYVHQSPEKKRYHKITLPAMLGSDLFDHQKLAAILSDSLGSELKADMLPLTKVEYRNSKELLISAEKKTFVLNTDTHALSAPPKKEKNEKEEVSPDKNWIAYQKDFNLYV